MNLFEIAFIALALGCDAFAVGMGVGARFCGPRQIFRLSFHFGLFQFMMPLLGWFAGQNLVGMASRWAPWIAFGLLFFIGARMIWENLFGTRDEKSEDCLDPTRGLNLIVLSVATSLDALGVGFSLGLLGAGLLIPAIWIGITAAAMTWSAMKIGNRLSRSFGRWMELAGGIILLGIAVKLVL